MNAANHAPTRCVASAQIVRCTPICREHVVIELSLRHFPPSQPGQFLQLLCRHAEDAEPALREWVDSAFPTLLDADLRGRQPYLRRPFSIGDRTDTPDGTTHLCVISRSVGPGTRWLEQLQPGDTLSIIGPLGRGFRIPADDVPLILVGGGVGIPPLLYLARRLHELGRRNVTAFIGARTRALLPVPLIVEPARDGAPTACVEFPGGARHGTAITSDDGTVGLHGTATDGLQRWHKRDRGRAVSAVVFACGPDGMLQAVAHVTRDFGLACQLCIETNMGCGLGTCLSCVVRVGDAGQRRGWRWALACTDGPVFARDELLDYGAVAST